MDVRRSYLVTGVPAGIRRTYTVLPAFFPTPRIAPADPDRPLVSPLPLPPLPAGSSSSLTLTLYPDSTGRIPVITAITTDLAPYFRAIFALPDLSTGGLPRRAPFRYARGSSDPVWPPPGYILGWAGYNYQGYFEWHLAVSLGGGRIIHMPGPNESGPDLRVDTLTPAALLDPNFVGTRAPPGWTPQMGSDIVGRANHVYDRYGGEDAKSKYIGDTCETGIVWVKKDGKWVDVLEANCAGTVHLIVPELRHAGLLEPIDIFGDDWPLGRMLVTDSYVDACLEALDASAERAEWVFDVVGSFDPNDKIGPGGFDLPGTLAEHRRGFVPANRPLPYVILFENLASASAPAQEVVITDQLELARVETSTFSFGPITFGHRQFLPAPGVNEFTTTLDLRPDRNLLLRIGGELHPETGVITWRFTSLDPETGEVPEDPDAGFLPPNRNPPEGEGSVLFSIEPRRGLETGTVIANRARILFDRNAAIDTPVWLNTLDATPPVSQVQTLAESLATPEVSLRLDGQDEGSGVGSYELYVSDNGGPIQKWAEGLGETAVFGGEYGHRYAFYSRARDHAGNVEAAAGEADAVTAIGLSIDSLIAVVSSYRASGDIRQAAYIALMRHLQSAKQLLDRNRLAAVRKRLTGPFLRTLSAQRRRGAVSAGAAERLTRLTQALVADLQLRTPQGLH